MGNALVEKKWMTKEEYFVFEEQATEKHEYEKGEVYAMSGGTPRHAQIGANVLRRLLERLDNQNCSVFTGDLKVAIDEYNSFLYPDATVICGNVEYAEGRKDVVKNPLLVVEVLSDSTEGYDRGGKFTKYRTLPTLREYVLVSQHKPLIEVFTKQDENHWLYTVNEGLEATVLLQSIESILTLREIYAKVEWTEQ